MSKLRSPGFTLYVLLCLAPNSGFCSPERSLPQAEATIAFHVSVRQSNVAFLPRFLNRIYHKDNLYLVDYAPPLQSDDFVGLPNTQNVYHRIADPFVENGVSEVINILDGMAFFLDREENLDLSGNSFDYYIHCTPDYYPVMNPAHMRQVLSTENVEQSPPNYIHFFHDSQLPFFAKEINRVVFDFSLSFNRSLPYGTKLYAMGITHPDYKKRIMEFPRAVKRFVVNHAFVKLATDSMLSKRLLMTLGDTEHVDERFFAALVANNKAEIGKVIHTTSLQCVNSNAMDTIVKDALPDFTPKPITIDFLRNTSQPCLFAGPFPKANDAILTKIDKELLIPPGTQGKPNGVGYHDHVYEKLQKLITR
ncbi:hypothetical protein FGB62_11g356 [Gracilaria domingensis]|nr:hypothetical protein FGB62_11g356 [Gracilaria domingensis]